MAPLAAMISVAEIDRILNLMEASSRVDLLLLTNQPQSCDSVPNPFLKLARQQPGAQKCWSAADDQCRADVLPEGAQRV
jgi:hypothetical protein